jgi:peroxiredoxin
VDSVWVQLDKTGKAVYTMPLYYTESHREDTENHRGAFTSPPSGGRGGAGACGVSYLLIPGKGGGEFILAEEQLRITCAEAQFHGGMLEFPQSEENAFMQRSFRQRNYLAQQREWLQMGEYFKSSEEKENAEFVALYNKMVEENNRATQQLDDVLKTSPLYSARFLELIRYMQQLYNALQNMDAVQQKILITEMETTLDINALYHSGNLWTDLHQYYSALFIDAGSGDPGEESYAASISLTMQRLQEPVLTAFLSSALMTCERTGRQKAQDAILTDFITRYPTMPITDSKVKRMLGALSLNKGAQMPPIAGLKQPVAQPAVIIFFDSDCDHCRHEVEYLITHYKEITDKGYRIISISSDIQQNDYQTFAATFPWNETDRLCDFKGATGENFKNYGIVGTPMIVVVDKNGVITGKYAQVRQLDF